MLKDFFPVALICTLVASSAAYSCGYGLGGRNGRLYVYMSAPDDAMFGEEAAPPAYPLVLTSMEEAQPYFDEYALATLERAVNWSEECVLVFAWTGAPDDRVTVMNKPTAEISRVFLYQAGTREGERKHMEFYKVGRDMNWLMLAMPAGSESLVDARPQDSDDA